MIEQELTPQGTLAERCRAGGAGIPAFFTPATVGTVVPNGELSLRYNLDGTVARLSQPRTTKIIHGREYLMEEAFRGDYAFFKAWKADRLGNLVFRYSPQNFNGVMARNAKHTIVEAEHIVEPGELDPAGVHVPGIYVKSAIKVTEEKGIEKRVYFNGLTNGLTNDQTPAMDRRERIVRRVAKEFKNGMYVNLGVGLPILAPTFVDKSVSVVLQSENGILGFGAHPQELEEDPDLINAGKETVTLAPGAACFGSEESFGMIRAGRINMTILGAIQVSARGDLANWMLPGKVKGFGGAMDLVSNSEDTKVVVTMEHTDKKGRAKILEQCQFPLTGKACVSRIITDLAVFDVDPVNGLSLVEYAGDATVDEIKYKTAAPFEISKDVKPVLE